MDPALRFLLLAELLGLVALPLTVVLLGRLSAGAAAFAKPLGLLAAGWLVWLASFAGIAYGMGSVVAVLVVLAVLNGGIALDRRAQIRTALGSRSFWAGEAVFVAAFGGMALLVAFAPDVWGTEKPMDMALINAINAGDELPPLNPWLSGERLDGYYYLGHLLAALAIRLTAVDPTVGYNLALALFYALAAISAFGVGAAIGAGAGRSPVRHGLVAVGLTVVAGNLMGAVLLVEHDGPLDTYPWFQASRVVPDTINEFPAFSWLLGDLHAHLMAVPFTLLALAFALQWLTSRARAVDVAAAGVVAGLLYAINSWSYPVVTGLLLLALAVRVGRRPAELLRLTALLLGAGTLAVSPFLLGFEPPAAGLELVESREELGTFLVHAGLLLGVGAWLVAGAYLAELGRLARRAPRGLAVAGALGVAIVAGLTPAGLGGAALFAAAAGFALWRVLRGREARGERFLWLTAFGAATCVALPELVFVGDAFAGGDLERMNTVFKLGYQAWILLALAATAALALVPGRLPRALQRAWVGGAVLLAIAAAAFPVAGAYARTGGFAGPARLNGLNWLSATAPGDVAAIAWLKAEAAGNAVVLESAGDDYSPAGHGRISTFTGRPTVLGWPGHVLQWGDDPGARRAEVNALYRATTPEAARPLLERYGVDHVVVGPLERADHGSAGIAKWDLLGTRVLERDGTVVWRIEG